MVNRKRNPEICKANRRTKPLRIIILGYDCSKLVKSIALVILVIVLSYLSENDEVVEYLLQMLF
jgi:hypothetical protein